MIHMKCQALFILKNNTKQELSEDNTARRKGLIG